MTVVKNSTNPRPTVQQLAHLAGQPIELELDIADVASDDYDVAVDESLELVDVTVIKNGASAGGTLTVKNGATAITDAIVAAVDKVVTRVGTIDRAQSTIPAGGTLRFSVNRGAGSGAMKVIASLLSKNSTNTLPVAP